MARRQLSPAEPMFEDAIDALPPSGFVPDRDLGDPASVGFRLLCLNKAVDITPSDTPPEKVIVAAEMVRLYLLGRHPMQIATAAREADAAHPKLH